MVASSARKAWRQHRNQREIELNSPRINLIIVIGKQVLVTFKQVVELNPPYFKDEILTQNTLKEYH